MIDFEKEGAQIEALCEIAFAAGLRIAISCRRDKIVTKGPFDLYQHEQTVTVFEHVMLSPGEDPPAGKAWIIYENRAGIPVGRSTRKDKVT